MNRLTFVSMFFYVLLSLALRATYGTYNPTWLIIITGAFAIFAGAYFRPTIHHKLRNSSESHSLSTRVSCLQILWAVLSLFCIELAISPRLVAGIDSLYIQPIRLLLATSALVSVAMCLNVWRKNGGHSSRRLCITCFAIITVGLFGARILVLFASPNPAIDVYTTTTQACDYLISGVNPYGAAYSDVYQGKFGYEAGCFYWPGYLYWALPFRYLVGDIRAGIIAADLISGLLLFQLMSHLGIERRISAICALLWWSNPVSLLVLEFAWIDPVLILGICALTTAWVNQRWILTGLCMGWIAGTKQYGAIVSLMIFVQLWTVNRAAAKTSFYAAVAAWFSLIAPFLVIDYHSFYKDTIAVYMYAPARADSLSWVAWLNNQFSIKAASWILLSFYILTIIICTYATWRLARLRPSIWIGTTACIYCMVFLVGRLAFCNYYYLVGFLVLLAMAFSMTNEQGVQITNPTRMGSAWLA